MKLSLIAFNILNIVSMDAVFAQSSINLPKMPSTEVTVNVAGAILNDGTCEIVATNQTATFSYRKDKVPNYWYFFESGKSDFGLNNNGLDRWYFGSQFMSGLESALNANVESNNVGDGLLKDLKLTLKCGYIPNNIYLSVDTTRLFLSDLNAKYLVYDPSQFIRANEYKGGGFVFMLKGDYTDNSSELYSVYPSGLMNIRNLKTTGTSPSLLYKPFSSGVNSFNCTWTSIPPVCTSDLEFKVAFVGIDLTKASQKSLYINQKFAPEDWMSNPIGPGAYSAQIDLVFTYD